ncbi:MAG: T9SS type A sorting domain-containing protein [Flavobacteriales bacterium]
MGDGGNQEIYLQKVVNGVATNIITSSGNISSSRTDYSFTIRVTHDEQGNWQLYTSALPTSNGQGLSPSANPTTASTVLQGTGNDSSILLNGNAYFGLAVLVPNLGGNNSNSRTTEFDNFYFTPCQPNTTVQFATTSFTENEADANTIQIPISITNPHPSVATTASVVLTSGDASSIGNYTTQSVTFPAGSSSIQYISVTISDDDICNGAYSSFTFSLENISGGYVAIAGNGATATLLVQDNEQVSAEILNENFESGSAADWFSPVVGSFNASTSNPINGAYSLRHMDQGQTNGGATSFSTYMNGTELTGTNTTWRFNVRTFNNEPNTSNYFIVCLTNDEADIANQTIDGYAVGIIPSFWYNQDYVYLWRTEGDYLYPIISTTIDWGTNLDKVGFEVTRDADGNWELKLDLDGDFDNLVSQGTAQDTYWSHLDYFGTYYVYNTSTIGAFSMDDILVTQESCANTYYSQMSGNSGDAIWSTSPVGTPIDVTGGPFSSFIVQNGHSVTLSENLLCHDFTIETGGTFSGSTATLNMRGNFVNDGTFTPSSGTVHFKGSQAQTISGTGVLDFYNIEMTNASGVSLNNAANLRGQLRPHTGTFNTNNQLTLISNATGTGSIGTIESGADVIGQITLQRYIPAGPQYYVYLANPILNQTLQDWNDDMTTTGFPGSNYPNYNFNNIYTYDETQPGHRNIGWTGATGITQAMNPQKGYIVYMNANAATVDATGEFQKGDIAVPLDYNDFEPGTGGFNADGWNLVSNIYPATIDWIALKQNSIEWGVDNASYYSYDAAASNYRSYNAELAAGTGNRYIASCQSFFIQSSSALQTLHFSESVKSTSSAAFQRDTEEASLIRFSLAKGTMNDEVLLVVKNDATFGFDEMYDAVKWDSPVATAPEMALMVNDTLKTSINSIPSFTENIEIPLWMEMPAAGTYTFKITQMQNIPTGSCLTIEDLVDGTITALGVDETISITVSAPYSGNRMIVRLTAPLQITSTNATCFGVADGNIQVTVPSEGWFIVAEDNLGNSIYATEGMIENLPAGYYTITMENVEALCTGNTAIVEIAEPELIQSEVQLTLDYCNSGESGRIEMMLGNAEQFEYILTSSEGVVVTEGSVEDSYKILAGLAHDIYSLQVISGCFNETTTVNLNDPNAVLLDVVLNTPSLELTVGETVSILADAISESEVEYEWIVNGFDGGDQNYLDFVVNTAGTYNIQCIATNGNCTATAYTQAIVTENENTVGVEEEVKDGPTAIITRMGNAVIVTFEKATSSKANIEIYNAAGALVMRVSGAANGGQVRTIDITGLSRGMYSIVIVQDNQKLAQQQIIK